MKYGMGTYIPVGVYKLDEYKQKHYIKYIIYGRKMQNKVTSKNCWNIKTGGKWARTDTYLSNGDLNKTV